MTIGVLSYCTADAPRPENTRRAYYCPDATCSAGPPGEMADWHCPHCDTSFRAVRNLDRIKKQTAEPADSA